MAKLLCLLLGKNKGGQVELITFISLMSLQLCRSYLRYFLGTMWNILEGPQIGTLSPILALEIYLIISVQWIIISVQCNMDAAPHITPLKPP